MLRRIHDHKEIFRKITESDEEAFRDLYYFYYDQIYSLSFSFLKSIDYAEDAVQEIFIKLWNKRSSLTNIENPESYLFVVTRNHLISTIRTKIENEQFTEHLHTYFKDIENNPVDQLIRIK